MVLTKCKATLVGSRKLMPNSPRGDLKTKSESLLRSLTHGYVFRLAEERVTDVCFLVLREIAPSLIRKTYICIDQFAIVTIPSPVGVRR